MAAAAAGDAGGALVTGPAGSVVLSQADLVTAAAAMDALLPASREPRREREIVVTGGRLEDPAVRRLLSWTLLSGAALVLEDDAATAVATAAWARPTVFQGDARELAALRKAVEEVSGRSRRQLPFGRLHTLLVLGEEELASGDCGFWQERGVHLARLAPAVMV